MNYHFAGKLRHGLLTNANAGGENVHRGELLGLTLGAHQGNTAEIADLVISLRDHAAIKREIDAFVECVLGSTSRGDATAASAADSAAVAAAATAAAEPTTAAVAAAAAASTAAEAGKSAEAAAAM